MNLPALTEATELARRMPCDQISVGDHVVIVCTNPISAHRWKAACPNGVLPKSRAVVQVVVLGAYEQAFKPERGA